jgi:sec-independent protein translocase protein TatA
MPAIGAPEIIVILVIALLVLGPKRLPEAGRGLGRGLREFKHGLKAGDEGPDPDAGPPA